MYMIKSMGYKYKEISYYSSIISFYNIAQYATAFWTWIKLRQMFHTMANIPGSPTQKVKMNTA